MSSAQPRSKTAIQFRQAILSSAGRRRRALVNRIAKLKRTSEPKWKRVEVACLIWLEAQPKRENELIDFLRSAFGALKTEPATSSWFVLRLGPSSFAMFVAFTDAAGHQRGATRRVMAALAKKHPELIVKPPRIYQAEVLGAKLADFAA